MIPGRSDPWFVRFDASTARRLDLFCFPNAGSGTAPFRSWAQALPPGVGFWVARLPGRESRLGEDSPRRMEEILAPLIESLRSRLDGTPFVLYGHSMGALIAYEVAQRLRAEGRRAGRLFISGHRAPHVPYPRDPLHNLDDDALLRELQRLGGTPDDFFQHPDLVELLLPTIRSDLELCETYRHAPGPALDCDITVYGGEDDPDVMKEDLQAWQAHSSKDTQIHMFPGDHFFIHNEQGAMLARLAQDLQDLMEAQA